MEGAWKKPTSKQVHVIKAIQGLSPGNIFGSFFSVCLFVLLLSFSHRYSKVS